MSNTVKMIFVISYLFIGTPVHAQRFSVENVDITEINVCQGEAWASRYYNTVSATCGVIESTEMKFSTIWGDEIDKLNAVVQFKFSIRLLKDHDIGVSLATGYEFFMSPRRNVWVYVPIGISPHDKVNVYVNVGWSSGIINSLEVSGYTSGIRTDVRVVDKLHLFGEVRNFQFASPEYHIGSSFRIVDDRLHMDVSNTTTRGIQLGGFMKHGSPNF